MCLNENMILGFVVCKSLCHSHFNVTDKMKKFIVSFMEYIGLRQIIIYKIELELLI